MGAPARHRRRPPPEPPVSEFEPRLSRMARMKPEHPARSEVPGAKASLIRVIREIRGQNLCTQSVGRFSRRPAGIHPELDGGVRGEAGETPNTKHQTSKKHQAPNTKRASAATRPGTSAVGWSWVFGVYLVFEVWCLVFRSRASCWFRCVSPAPACFAACRRAGGLLNPRA